MATLTKSTGTVTLSGAAEKVTLPASYGWVWVKNMSEGDIFAGLSADISEGADGVLTIPAGECGRVKTDGSREFYLLGTGNALVAAQNYADCPFKVGGKGGEIPDLSAYAKKTDVPNIKVNEAVNADTLDGHHEDYFAKSTNPSIEGNIYLLRSGNATTKGFIFAWEETVRIRNEDPNAENTTYTDLIVTPDGIYTESTTNGVIKGRTKIESGKPYVTGSATVAANTNICESNHGFIPSAVIWWNSESSGVAKPLSETQFIMDSVSTYERAINYMMFK